MSLFLLLLFQNFVILRVKWAKPRSITVSSMPETNCFRLCKWIARFHWNWNQNLFLFRQMDHPHSLDNAMRHYERTITAKLQCIVVTESILTTNRCHSEVRNFISHISENKNIIYYNTHSHTHTTVLRPLYRSTGISRHLQLRTGGFCWCKVLLPGCPCWRQPVHSD